LITENLLSVSINLIYFDFRTAPDATYRGEQTIDVTGGKAEIASDYTKKKHVFRLK
jgi:hypothetical protein